MDLISKWHCCTLQRYSLTTVVKLKTPRLLLYGSGCETKTLVHNTKANFVAKPQWPGSRDRQVFKQPVWTKGYLNHSALWHVIDNITLHATSKKLLNHMELYSVFNLTLCCFGNQTPQMIKSKKSIAAYKLMKHTLIGTCSQLRKRKQRNFSYKWFFLAAELQSIALTANVQHNASLPARKPLVGLWQPSGRAVAVNGDRQGGLGINNVFIWPELDRFDYAGFSQMPGLDVIFYYKTLHF